VRNVDYLFNVDGCCRHRSEALAGYRHSSPNLTRKNIHTSALKWANTAPSLATVEPAYPASMVVLKFPYPLSALAKPSLSCLGRGEARIMKTAVVSDLAASSSKKTSIFLVSVVPRPGSLDNIWTGQMLQPSTFDCPILGGLHQPSPSTAFLPTALGTAVIRYSSLALASRPTHKHLSFFSLPYFHPSR